SAFIFQIIFSIQSALCKLELKRDKEVIVDIDSPELHQSQYHTADFDTSAYNYGYAVEPNGQFHHETRGGDGVTYGCYGYIDSDDLLKVTHYVADSQGYRTLEHEKPVLVYPINENNVDADEKHYKPKGVMLDWKDLYFPIGCGMSKGGVLLNTPVIRAPGGTFQQLGETKFPVLPSVEPKVITPRIPFNNGIKTEPTKLTPIGGASVDVTERKSQDPKTTASTVFVPSKSVTPLRETTPRSTITPSVSTKNTNIHVPQFDIKTSYRQSQRPTTQPAAISTSLPTRFRSTLPPFRESVKVNGITTVKVPIDNFPKVPAPDSSKILGQLDYTDDLLPPFRTTTLPDAQTTIGVPFNSYDPDNDLNIINSYANLNPDSRTTTPDYVGEITTTVPIRGQPFSTIYNNNGPSTISSFQRPDLTQKISTIRPNKFDGFNLNVQTTTETPIEYITEPSAESTNPDSTTVLSTGFELLSSSIDGQNSPDINQPLKDISYKTSVEFSSNQPKPTGLGVNTGVSSNRPAIESNTDFNIVTEFETTTSQSTYPGIGDYRKPQAGFEFNIPTRAPIQVSTASIQSFVTNIASNGSPVNGGDTPGNPYFVANRQPNNDNVDKTTTFTNGPHGSDYQLGGSRIPHYQSTTRSRDPSYDFLNPIKLPRKEENPAISPITPLTHLTISGSFPSANNDNATPVETNSPNVPTTQFVNDFTSGEKSSTPIYTDSLHNFVPQRTNTEVTDRPQQHSSFFTVTTPGSPTRGVITHMKAISQTRFQSSRVTPTLTSVSPNDKQNSNDLNLSQPPDSFNVNVRENVRVVTSTEYPFLYTRSRTPSSNTENTPKIPSPDHLYTSRPPNNGFSKMGARIIPGINPATSSYTAYHPGTTQQPNGEEEVPQDDQKSNYNAAPYDKLPAQPKFVLRPTANSNRKPNSNFNGYPEAENRNANFYPDSNQQKSTELNDKVPGIYQPEGKYVNSKKEFVPQYNPSSTPIPGSLGTAIGVYPPNVDDLSPEIPNFNIAISKWPFYILPFPFTNGNIMTLFNGMPIQLGGNGGNTFPVANINTGTGGIGGIGLNSGSDLTQVATNIGSNGNGNAPQSICSWLSSFVKPKNNATNAETPTNENGETLQISNLQVNIKDPQLQVSQNPIQFGIVGFIPIIAVPNCQNNVQGVDTSSIVNSLQVPNLCSQLSQLLAPQINTKDTNQPLPT
ncbi:hypothetical protein Bhyg_08799, partial [Pseudolycoriella hygida]